MRVKIIAIWFAVFLCSSLARAALPELNASAYVVDSDTSVTLDSEQSPTTHTMVLTANRVRTTGDLEVGGQLYPLALVDGIEADFEPYYILFGSSSRGFAQDLYFWWDYVAHELHVDNFSYMNGVENTGAFATDILSPRVVGDGVTIEGQNPAVSETFTVGQENGIDSLAVNGAMTAHSIALDSLSTSTLWLHASGFVRLGASSAAFYAGADPSDEAMGSLQITSTDIGNAAVYMIPVDNMFSTIRGAKVTVYADTPTSPKLSVWLKEFGYSGTATKTSYLLAESAALSSGWNEVDLLRSAGGVDLNSTDAYAMCLKVTDGTAGNLYVSRVGVRYE